MKYTGVAGFLVFFATSPLSTHAALVLNSVGSPVERVVDLLKDLQDKLGLDQRAEQQIYDKYACWCEKTTDRKAADITAAQQELRSLGQTILSLKGQIATLKAEIEQLAAELAAIEEATKQATTIREKENSAFMAETTEIKTAMTSLQQAIEVLLVGSGKVPEKESFLQTSALKKATFAVKQAISAIPPSMSMKPGQLDELTAFLQAGSSSKYTPQSFTVQGILSDMYNNFAVDLETSTHAEADSNRKFEEFMDLKANEKARAENLKRKKEGLKGDAEARLADTQQVYDDTTAQKEADIKFFDATRSSCLSKHDAWDVRKALRTEEIAGIKQALGVLTSDTNRELFENTIKAGKETGAQDSFDTGRDITAFVQVQSFSSEAAEAAARSNAFAILKQKATQAHSIRLAALAARVRLGKFGHFEKVIAAITTMIQDLQDEGEADIKKRDQCKDEYQKIESTVQNVTWLIEKNKAKIDKLNKLIVLRTKQRDATIAAIQKVDADKATLKQDREAANAAFVASKEDDQQAIDALMSARTMLTKFYKKNKIHFGPIQGGVKDLALAQQGPDFEISADQAPEAEFSDKGQRKGETKDIVSMMTMLIEDLDDEIKNDMKAEEGAQLEYEAIIKDLNSLRKDLVAKKDSLVSAIAKRGQELTDEEQDKTNNKADLKDELDYKASITDDCNFILRTFSKRASDRVAEMEGLEGAKSFLAGKKDTAGFVQTNSLAFDDGALSHTSFAGLRR